MSDALRAKQEGTMGGSLGGLMGGRVKGPAAVVGVEPIAAVAVVELRDYFALHAPFWRLLVPPTLPAEIELLARQAYAYADIMLEIRLEKAV